MQSPAENPETELPEEEPMSATSSEHRTTLLEPSKRSRYLLGVNTVIATATLGGCLSVLPLLDPATTSWSVSAIELILFVLVAIFGGWLALIDARTHRLPDTLMIPLYISVLGLTLSEASIMWNPSRYGWALLGGVALAGVYFLIGLTGAAGFGDVKLAGVLGFYLSWHSWQTLLTAAILAYVLAAPHAAYVLLRRRKNPSLPKGVPFGPYMVLGALIATATTLIAG